MHLPVLKKEVIEHLDPQPNDDFIDCTAGEGGHALAILEKNRPKGKVLAIEVDRQLYENLKVSKIKNQKPEIKNRLILVNDSFVNLENIVKREGLGEISGILFDLGISSWHIDESSRGFSFRKDEPLDMRYSLNNKITAWEIVNSWPPEEIELILKELGEERLAKRITKAIIFQRKKKKIETALELAELIEREVPRTKRIHPATKTFQALRIIVNQELENIERTLPLALELLKNEGRMSVISFHSLEDRIVKNFFKQAAVAGKVRILTKKPIIPTKEEIINNPRSRSAKLRTVIKCKKS